MRRRAPAARRSSPRSWSAAARLAGRTCRESAPSRACGRTLRGSRLRASRPETPDKDLARRRTNSSASVAESPMRGFCRAFALETSQHVEEIEAPGFGDELVEVAHRSLRAPRRGGQRMISPRSDVRITVWVKVIEADIFAEETIKDRADQKRPRPFKGFVVDRHGDFGARAAAPTPLATADAPDDRPRIDAADAANFALRRAVRHVGEQARASLGAIWRPRRRRAGPGRDG